jgi:hypothetical protein
MPGRSLELTRENGLLTPVGPAAVDDEAEEMEPVLLQAVLGAGRERVNVRASA